MDIDKYKLIVNRFTAELEGEIDRNKRTLVTSEVDIYEVSTQDNQDGSYNMCYKSKLVGSTIVQQGEDKPKVAKSKRSQSQKLRAALWSINPEEGFYQTMMDKLIINLEDVIDFLKDR